MRKKTKEEHRRLGTMQKVRHDGPSPGVELPPMPPDLSSKGQPVWHDVCEAARYLGVISKVDGRELRLLCESWLVYTEANDEVMEHGVCIDVETRHGVVRRKNPAIDVRDAALRQCDKLLSKFGLNPLARTGLKAFQAKAGDQEESQKLAGIVKFRGAS